jgi:hypothetical protein
VIVIRRDAHRAVDVEPVARAGEASLPALEIRVGVPLPSAFHTVTVPFAADVANRLPSGL